MSRLFDPEILYVTKSEYKDGWGFNEHAHPDYFQMFCVVSGCCTINVGGRAQRVSEGNSAIVCAAVPHSLYTSPGERAMVIDVKFILHSGAQELSKYAGFRPTPDAEFMRGMELIADEAVHKKPLFKELIESRLTELLLGIVRSEHIDDTGTAARRSVALTGVASEIARYIEENYERCMTLDELADELGYSKIYLCQCFKKQTDMSIFEYLYDVRLRRAAALLKDTDLTHEQIITRTGFKTVNHFGRLFKQAYGESPGRYRRRMREIVDVPVFLSQEYFSELNKTERTIISAAEER